MQIIEPSTQTDGPRMVVANQKAVFVMHELFRVILSKHVLKLISYKAIVLLFFDYFREVEI